MQRYLITLIGISAVYSQVEFVDHFASCHKGDPRFDNCLKEAINSVRPYFKTGLPQFGVAPFDPFHCEEVTQTRGSPSLNYKLTLRNVSEAGWTSSQITRFKSDLDNNYIQFTHYFPDKRLHGNYDFDATVLGRQIRNSGTWNLALFDYVQTMTVSRQPRQTHSGTMIYDTPIKVNVSVHSCRHMELHASNLLGGYPFVENIADRVINAAWPPGFILLRPLVGDLVGTAFTKIMDDNFHNFPFNALIH